MEPVTVALVAEYLPGGSLRNPLKLAYLSEPIPFAMDNDKVRYFLRRFAVRPRWPACSRCNLAVFHTRLPVLDRAESGTPSRLSDLLALGRFRFGWRYPAKYVCPLWEMFYRWIRDYDRLDQSV